MFPLKPSFSFQRKFPEMGLSDVRVWLAEPIARIYKGQARLADHELRHSPPSHHELRYSPAK